MKRTILSTLLGGTLLIATAVTAPGDPTIKQRAVSLRVIQSTLKKGDSQMARSLCGITRLNGYIVDSKSHDVILVGAVDTAYPPLHIDDFAVALRNVWHLYAKKEGNVVYYTPPGCSIDPDPSVVAELNNISEKMNLAPDIQTKRQCLDEWKSLSKRHQTVRVLGVPFYSHFAKVMVDADYYMKRLVSGTVKLDIPGFKSLTDLGNERTLNGGGDASDIPSLNRFWFCPGESTFDDSGGMVKLLSCDVILLTEEEMLTSHGKIQGYGRPSTLGKIFADSFSARYNEIAEARPIYKELEALFRLTAIANLMRYENALESSGMNLRYLFHEHQVGTAPVSPNLPGLTDVQEISQDVVVHGQKFTQYFWHMSYGGVSMDVHPKRVGPARTAASPATKAPATTGQATSTGTKRVRIKPARPRPQSNAHAEARETVLKARTSSEALFWDLPDADE